MDRLVYLAMGGARETLQAQAVIAHNLANVSTAGYRADTHAFEHLLVAGPGHPSRVNTMAGTYGFDDAPGAVTDSSRELDVAVSGPGWLAVQAPDGTEAYTRAGDLHLTPLGQLTTGAGHPVLGDGGPIAIPPHDDLVIGDDGTISIVPQGSSAATLVLLDRIKLVDPPREALVKRLDGLIATRDGEAVTADADVRLVSGALEQSNVNMAGALVDMIALSRRFEMQMKAMQTARDDAEAAARMMQMS